MQSTLLAGRCEIGFWRRRRRRRWGLRRLRLLRGLGEWTGEGRLRRDIHRCWRRRHVDRRDAHAATLRTLEREPKRALSVPRNEIGAYGCRVAAVVRLEATHHCACSALGVSRID